MSAARLVYHCLYAGEDSVLAALALNVVCLWRVESLKVDLDFFSAEASGEDLFSSFEAFDNCVSCGAGAPLTEQISAVVSIAKKTPRGFQTTLFSAPPSSVACTSTLYITPAIARFAPHRCFA
jgi:hypothetical protein